MNLYYSWDYVVAGTDFDTTRKAGLVEASLRERPITGVRVMSPVPLTIADLCRVHTPELVEAVRTGKPKKLAESNGFAWNAAIWTAATASNGGALKAAWTALSTRRNSGSLSSGLHHARRDIGGGFCTFNGLALAAKDLSDYGARVLILDLDAHCGGGTYSLVAELPNVVHLDISVSHFDSYKPVLPHRLKVVNDAKAYLPSIQRRLAALGREGFDVLIYNAGMDPYEGDMIGGLDGITRRVLRQRERLVFEWAASRRLPVAFVLAGGYSVGEHTTASLVNLHRLTIKEAANWMK